MSKPEKTLNNPAVIAGLFRVVCFVGLPPGDIGSCGPVPPSPIVNAGGEA